MNLAITLKSVRESQVLFFITLGGVMLLEFLFVGLSSSFPKEFEDVWLTMPIVRRILQMLGGAELAGGLTPEGLISFGLAHPVMFALIWAFVVASASRGIVGEIEQGTADIVLSLPVSRVAVYGSVTVGWVVCVIPICAGALAGAKLGTLAFTLPRPLDFALLINVIPNLTCLCIAIGCLTMCCSSFVLRRGVAVCGVIAYLLASFLVNFLAQVWTSAKPFSVLGLMNYYKPMAVVSAETLPFGDMVVLLGAGAMFWCVGLLRYATRDVPAV